MTLVIKTTGVEEYLDANGEAHVKALILGEPSAGKTRSASFWPRPIFADCEDGRMSLADRRMPYARIRSSQDMDDLLHRLDIECRIKRGPDRAYQTLVIDTLDTHQRQVIQEIQRATHKEALSGWQDWGLLDTKMTNFVAALARLPMNIVVNVHIKTRQDGDDGPVIREPKLKGDLREQIAAEFDLVGYMSTFWEAENGQRVLKRGIRWAPEPSFPILKDRSGQLPAFTEVTFTEADYENLREAMFGGEYFEQLRSGEQVEEIPTTATEAEPPRPGGPVTTKTTKATKKTEPVKASVEPAPKTRRVVPASKTATSAQPAAKIAETPAAQREPGDNARSGPVQVGDTQDKATVAPEAMAQAEEEVAAGLGGQVISRTAAPEEAPTSGQTLVCGTPARNATNPYPGCGKDLTTLGPEAIDLINIALLKTKTSLCPDCLAKWRSENKR